MKGGTTAGGQRAAASHTGSLASDERVFAGICRQTGITRATTIEEAFEAAATFATQPLPAGPRTAVVTTAGGWGVVTADAITRDGRSRAGRAARRSPGRHRRASPAALEPEQPDRPRGRRDPRHDSRSARARRAPSRASTRSSTSASASNRIRRASLREGGFYPDHGLERIVAYHERQDARFAQAAADISDATGQADPDRDGARDRHARQPRARNRPRDRPALLRIRESGRDRARTPLALRALPPDARARLTTASRAGRRARCSRSPVGCASASARVRRIPSRSRARRTPLATPALATPLWSPRRVPSVLVRGRRGVEPAAATRGHRRAVRRAASRSTGRRSRRAPRARAGRSPARRPRSSSSPARRSPCSGPVTGSRPVRSRTRRSTTATLDGDLTIVGGGDPMLTTSTAPSTASAPNTPLAALADAIVARRACAGSTARSSPTTAATTARAPCPTGRPTT